MHGVRAEQLDPLSPLHPAGLAGIYWMAGQLDQAIPVGRKALELFPGFAYGWSTLAWIYSSAERHEEALEASLKASALNPDWGWVVAQAQAAAGHGDEARQVLADYERLSEADPLGVASARASLGETEEAIQWLEAAFAARHRWLPWINVMPNFHVLEADPRFQDLLRRMNFPE